ncbi:unnamed protein product [Staurois parvus]|uniref:Uncharacterized protein n=1 Tax=Staurois parvus TaxID=386267 RepID=A0ABN9GCI6_9NEOB|nr:unnamed protein product [Staurois parvus]
MRGFHHPCTDSQVCTPAVLIMRGSHHLCTDSQVCTPAVLMMRGSHHPCAEFPGLYTSCAHYEGFPPSMY